MISSADVLISNVVLIAIAIGLLVMMYPILCKVKFETLHLVFRKREIWIQIGFSILMNWLVAPFLMVSLPYFQTRGVKC